MSAFHHDGEDFWDVTTAADAQREAVASIERWRPDDGDCWSSDYVERVAWGITVQEVVELPGELRCQECGEDLPSVPEPVDWLDGRPIVPPHRDGTGAECNGLLTPTCDYVLRDVPDLAERIAEVLRDRPEVWLAVLRSMPQEVLGPWQANDRSKPPVPETVQRVRYGVGIVSVVWDRGEAFALRWRWRCGSGMGDAATREEAEAAADQHARDRGVMLVEPTERGGAS